MKNKVTIEIIGWLISIVGLGVVLTAYAHTNFATKDEIKTLKKDLSATIKVMDQRIYDIHKATVPSK